MMRIVDYLAGLMHGVYLMIFLTAMWFHFEPSYFFAPAMGIGTLITLMLTIPYLVETNS